MDKQDEMILKGEEDFPLTCPHCPTGYISLEGLPAEEETEADDQASLL